MLEIDDSRGEKVISGSKKLPIANCRLPIWADFGFEIKSAIGNRKLAINVSSL
jgi:hypothetical protein